MGLFSSTPTEQIVCPLCDKSVKASKTKPLYDIPVCMKCRNGFASRRRLAYFFDSIGFGILTFVIYLALAFALAASFGTQQMRAILNGWTLGVIVPWIVLPLIFTFKDGFSGMSLGKRMMGVEVVDRISREPIGFRQSLKRNLLLLVPFLPLVLAFMVNRGYRLGDKWANTAVIWRKYRYKLPFDQRGILCMKCGYNLTGNQSGRCPECGTEIPVTTAPALSRPIPALAG